MTYRQHHNHPEASWKNVYGHMEGHEFRFLDVVTAWAYAEDANTIRRAFNSDEPHRIARRIARALTYDPRWLSRALEREQQVG